MKGSVMLNLANWIPKVDTTFSALLHDLPVSVWKTEAQCGVTVIIESGSLIYHISYFPELDETPDYLSIFEPKSGALLEYFEIDMTSNEHCRATFEQCQNLVDKVMGVNGYRKGYGELG